MIQLARAKRQDVPQTDFSGAFENSAAENFRLTVEQRGRGVTYERVFNRADFRDVFEDVYAVALTGYYYGRKTFYIASYEAE